MPSRDRPITSLSRSSVVVYDHLSQAIAVIFGMSAPRLSPFTATKVLIIIESYSSAVDRIETGEMDHEIPVLTILSQQI